jgi:hypothetical protein
MAQHVKLDSLIGELRLNFYSERQATIEHYEMIPRHPDERGGQQYVPFTFEGAEYTFLRVHLGRRKDGRWQVRDASVRRAADDSHAQPGAQDRKRLSAFALAAFEGWWVEHGTASARAALETKAQGLRSLIAEEERLVIKHQGELAGVEAEIAAIDAGEVDPDSTALAALVEPALS